MEIEPFLVASSVSGILAQRLVRRICLSCRQPVSLASSEQIRFPALAGTSSVFRGAGCGDCRGTGYHGRTGIFELLVIDDEIKNLVVTKQDARAIKQRAIEKGMTTLLDDGIRKVLEGETTVEEVLRVTNRDYAEL